MDHLHYLGAALGLGMVVIGAALGIGKFASAAAEGIARQPAARCADVSQSTLGRGSLVHEASPATRANQGVRSQGKGSRIQWPAFPRFARKPRDRFA